MEKIKKDQKTYIMGIINITPDSFSGDGNLKDGKINIVDIIDQAQKHIDCGAKILDIGGESTRPGADFVNAQDEITRVEKAIIAIRKKFPNIIISIDTYKAIVAEKAILAGANIINDVYGGLDEFMFKVSKQYNAQICLMHNNAKPEYIEIDSKIGGKYLAQENENFINNLIDDLKLLVKNALNAGVDPDNIIIDPGIGFGKTYVQNMLILKHIDLIKQIGYPVLIGASNKSFIGEALDCAKDEREIGTCVTSVFSQIYGAEIVRVHNSKSNFEAIKMTREILNAK